MSGFGVFLAIATAFSWALGCVVHTTDLKGGGDTGGHAHPAAAGERGARHLLPGYGRSMASVAAFVLAGGGLRSVRDHHRATPASTRAH